MTTIESINLTKVKLPLFIEEYEVLNITLMNGSMIIFTFSNKEKYEIF
jgi:hypothetical protein